MKTVSAVELRNNLEGIVKSLKRGERMELTYRGERIAELIPVKPTPKMTPLEALRRAQEITARDPEYLQKAETYLKELREDQKAMGSPSPPDRLGNHKDPARRSLSRNNAVES